MKPMRPVATVTPTFYFPNAVSAAFSKAPRLAAVAGETRVLHHVDQDELPFRVDPQVRRIRPAVAARAGDHRASPRAFRLVDSPRP